MVDTLYQIVEALIPSCGNDTRICVAIALIHSCMLPQGPSLPCSITTIRRFNGLQTAMSSVGSCYCPKNTGGFPELAMIDSILLPCQLRLLTN